MSTLLKFLGIFLGVTVVLSGAFVLSDFSDSNLWFIGVILIIQGVFQCCFSLIVGKIYDNINDIKDNNLSYLENLIVYTKNQIKEMNEKLSDEKRSEK